MQRETNRHGNHHTVRTFRTVAALFMTVGICGGFTTFSTFSKEALMMLQAGDYMGLLAYVGISVLVGIALVAAGYYLTR